MLSIVCMVLLVTIPASAMSAAVGLVQPNGAVLLNGSEMNQQSAIFSGDVIQTRANAKAVVTSNLLVASLGENSRMELAPTGLQLRSGIVVVRAEKAATATVAGANIVAARGGKFVVRSGTDKVQIASLVGDLKVIAGDQTVVVPAGKGIMMNAFDENDPPRTAKKRNTGWLNNDDLATLILISGAVAAGVGLGLYNALKDDGSVSPVAP
jgi:hypothetical protein